MNILRAMPKETRRFLWFLGRGCKDLWGDCACVACDKCENPEAFPPFPFWGGVLTTNIGELGIIVGEDMDGEIDNDVTKSIIENDLV